MPTSLCLSIFVCRPKSLSICTTIKPTEGEQLKENIISKGGKEDVNGHD